MNWKMGGNSPGGKGTITVCLGFARGGGEIWAGKKDVNKKIGSGETWDRLCSSEMVISENKEGHIH